MFSIFKGYVLVVVAKWINAAAITCNLNQYTFKDSNSNIRCVDCLQCPEGMGTVPQCGAFLGHVVEVVCGACVAGRTYSSSNDVTSCDPCTVCVDNEIVIKNCTPTSNTVCGKCKPGYYRTFVHSCDKCSTCCEDTKLEDLEEQCLKQGFPVDGACQYTERNCGKETQVLPSAKPEGETRELQVDYIVLKKWHVYLIVALVVLLFILVIVTLVVRFPRGKRTDRKKQIELIANQHELGERKHLCLPSNSEQNDALDGKSLSSISTDI